MNYSLPEDRIEAWRQRKFGEIKDPAVYVERAFEEMVEAALAAGIDCSCLQDIVMDVTSREFRRGTLGVPQSIETVRWELAQTVIVISGAFVNAEQTLAQTVANEISRLEQMELAT